MKTVDALLLVFVLATFGVGGVSLYALMTSLPFTSVT